MDHAVQNHVAVNCVFTDRGSVVREDLGYCEEIPHRP